MKKLIFVLALFVMLALALPVAPVLAEHSSNESSDEHREEREHHDDKFKGMMSKAMGSMINITPSGQVNLRNAEIVSLSGSEAEVEVWGLKFHIDFAGVSANGLEEGDKVMINGMMSESSGVIKATMVQNMDVTEKKIAELQAKIAEIQKMIEALRDKDH